MSALTLRVPIRFSDIDAFNHVNHTRYLSYCEDHRMEMLADLRKTCLLYTSDAADELQAV